jgi:ABC-2 type transport system permease protein
MGIFILFRLYDYYEQKRNFLKEGFILYRTFKIAQLELKKPKTIRNLMFTMAIFLILSYILNIDTGIGEVPQTFKCYIPHIFLFNTFFILGCEFENNTDKVLFTGIFKRHEILLSKMFSMIVKGIIVWLSYVLLNVIINVFVVQNPNFTLINIDLLKSLISIIIYSFSIGSIIFLISIITSNSKLSGIFVYILFYDLMFVVISNAVESKSLSENIKYILINSPFYIANPGVVGNGYNLLQSMILLVTGIICLYITNILLNKKHV